MKIRLLPHIQLCAYVLDLNPNDNGSNISFDSIGNMTIHARSLFDMDNSYTFDLYDLKEKLSDVLINEEYPLNGGILEIIPYELGFLIISEGIIDIYTHKVLYADVIDCMLRDTKSLSSYSQEYRFSSKISAIKHYHNHDNRIEIGLSY